MTIGSLIPDDAQAPGYCSVATRPLTPAQIKLVITASSNNAIVPGVTVFSEKTLVGKGTRKLILVTQVPAWEGEPVLVEYAGVRKAKFVSKDAERFEAMVAAALSETAIGESFDNIHTVRNQHAMIIFLQ